MTKWEIVQKLADGKVVEAMLANIARRPITGPLLDLVQETYVCLLGTPEEKIRTLYEAGRLNYFIARVLTNQYLSSHSPFHYTFRRPQLLGREVNENDATTDQDGQ